jgi:uncharacterized protein YbjT (DUF2867 family)
MPVLVTAAHQPLARRLAARLLEEGGEVRVYTSGEVASLRAAGAFVATGTRDDEGRLEAALAQVHTVVHVGGGIATPDPEQLVRDARVLARAATGAEVRRVVMLSLPGADPDAEDPLRAAKGRVEAVLAAIPCPTITLRVGLVDTPLLRDALITSGLEPDLLDTEVAPVRAADVAELVVAFDRARSRSPEGHLVVAADGPQRLSLAGYLDRVSVDRPGRGSLVGRRIPDPAAAERLVSILRGPWWSTDPTIVDGWSFAGLDPAVPGVS